MHRVHEGNAYHSQHKEEEEQLDDGHQDQHPHFGLIGQPFQNLLAAPQSVFEGQRRMAQEVLQGSLPLDGIPKGPKPRLALGQGRGRRRPSARLVRPLRIQRRVGAPLAVHHVVAGRGAGLGSPFVHSGSRRVKEPVAAAATGRDLLIVCLSFHPFKWLLSCSQLEGD